MDSDDVQDECRTGENLRITQDKRDPPRKDCERFCSLGSSGGKRRSSQRSLMSMIACRTWYESSSRASSSIKLVLSRIAAKE